MPCRARTGAFDPPPKREVAAREMAQRQAREYVFSERFLTVPPFRTARMGRANANRKGHVSHHTVFDSCESSRFARYGNRNG